MQQRYLTLSAVALLLLLRFMEPQLCSAVTGEDG